MLLYKNHINTCNWYSCSFISELILNIRPNQPYIFLKKLLMLDRLSWHNIIALRHLIIGLLIVITSNSSFHLLHISKR
jgi:hypothetical protein